MVTLLATTPNGHARFKVDSSHPVAWFLSPSGADLWSFAPDCVDVGSKGKPDNPAYNARALFPTDHAWVTDTVEKLRSWGFNSLGGWSDTGLFDKYTPQSRRLPYIVVLHLGAYAKAPWDDLYSPNSERSMHAAARTLIPPLHDDPFLIGYCTDNELGWWDDTLFLSYFKMPASAPGKQALLTSLKSHYHGDFASFQKEWNTTAASFSALAAAQKITLKAGTHGITAVHAFNAVLARHYYTLVRHLVRLYDKHHLILGDRYCQYYNLETAEAAKPFVDVISTNEGADWVDGGYTHFQLDTLHRLTGKPVLITEFYFAAQENQSGDRNSGKGFPTVQTQGERARGFAACVRHFASLPYVVGAHWFQFTDEPPKGRGDGEDFNMGLVDVHGKPYLQMIAAARTAQVERVHAAEKRAPRSGIPAAPREPMGDALLHWNRGRAYVPSPSREQWADLYASYDSSNLYVGLVAMEFIDESLYSSGKLPEQDRPTLTLRIGAWHATIRFNGKAEKAVCSDPNVEIAENPGLKHTLVLRIPSRVLGPRALLAGRRVPLKGALTSHGHGFRMTWNKRLTLA
ncbi:MAG: hypothetical protein ACYC96_05585 [Fimbriimonadaceae bacterium]